MQAFNFSDVLFFALYPLTLLWVSVLIALVLERKRYQHLPHYISEMRVPTSQILKHTQSLPRGTTSPPTPAKAMFPDVRSLSNGVEDWHRTTQEREQVVIQINPDAA